MTTSRDGVGGWIGVDGAGPNDRRPHILGQAEPVVAPQPSPSLMSLGHLTKLEAFQIHSDSAPGLWPKPQTPAEHWNISLDENNGHGSLDQVYNVPCRSLKTQPDNLEDKDCLTELL